MLHEYLNKKLSVIVLCTEEPSDFLLLETISNFYTDGPLTSKHIYGLAEFAFFGGPGTHFGGMQGAKL